jgi:30S ribosomal protein 3
MKKFRLKILWLDHNIAFSVDHIVKHGQSPLTSYFFWPRNDAWSQIKNELESKPWISENDKIDILNEVAETINGWQENS